MKELLFHGADRQALTSDGFTALDIVEASADYFTGNQLRSLRVILQDHISTECFTRYRPIKPVTRSWRLVVLNVFTNLLVSAILVYWIYMFYTIKGGDNDTELFFLTLALACFFVTALLFTLTVALSPGYLRPAQQFVDLV